MDDQLTIYVRLLGFSEAIRSSDETRIEKIHTLLRNIALLRDGLYEVSVGLGIEEMIRPSVSTFSGGVIISYPAERLRSTSKGLETGLELAQLLVSQLAIEALKLDFLIRGGATVGPLYHQDGEVMGIALLDAYELESKISVYPRISISPHLYSQLEPYSLFVAEDDDGVRHFKYIQSMIIWNEEIEGVLLQLDQIVDENVEKFERQGRLNKLAKWIWFRTIYSELRSQFLRNRLKELATTHYRPTLLEHVAKLREGEIFEESDIAVATGELGHKVPKMFIRTILNDVDGIDQEQLKKGKVCRIGPIDTGGAARQGASPPHDSVTPPKGGARRGDC